MYHKHMTDDWSDYRTRSICRLNLNLSSNRSLLPQYSRTVVQAYSRAGVQSCTSRLVCGMARIAASRASCCSLCSSPPVQLRHGPWPSGCSRRFVDASSVSVRGVKNDSRIPSLRHARPSPTTAVAMRHNPTTIRQIRVHYDMKPPHATWSAIHTRQPA